MLVAHARRLSLSLLTSVTSLLVLNLLSGFVVGVSVLYWHHLASMLLGVNPMATAGLGCGVLTALLLRSLWRTSTWHFRHAASQNAWQSWALALLALALTTFTMPYVIQLGGLLVGYCGAWLQGHLGLGAVAFLVGFWLIGVPLAAFCQLPEWCHQATTGLDQHSPPVFRWFFSGMTFGFLAHGFVLAPTLGTQGAAMTAMLLSVLLASKGIWKAVCGSENTHRTISTDDSLPAATAKSGKHLWRLIPISLAVGVALAAWIRIQAQWSPATAHQLCAELAAMLGGILFGQWFAVAKPRPGARLALILGCVAWSCLIFIGFSSMIQGLVWLNIHVTTPALLISLRGLLPALVCFPLGIIWSNTLCAADETSRERGFGIPRGHVTIAVSLTWVAFLATHQWGLTAIGPAICYVVAMWMLGGLAVIEVISRRCWPSTWRARSLFAAAASLLIAIGFLSNRYQPDLSARVLFASNILQASGGGLPFSQLPVLDEGRRIEMREGTHGTYSAWKFHGAQVQLRENGVPMSVISTDPAIFPHFSAELLPGVLPLVLHEKPREVLLLGLGSGTALQACLASPVLNVTCVEPDAELRSLISALPQRLPLKDERLVFEQTDPVWAVATGKQTFDVVISSPGQSALWHTSPQYTEEFFRNASRQLAPGGIFCQRFQYIDYGATPLLAMACTLQNVFSDVMAIEMGQGEILFVGTNAPEGLVRPGLLSRMQSTHVRQLLSEVGWDWTLLLTLGAYDHATLTALVEQQPQRPNSTANAYLAYSLPAEIIRFGPKQLEVQQLFAPRMGKLLQWIGEDGTRPEVLRRLSEVSGQYDLMVRFTDQFWAYRKSVREEVTKRPLSLIKQVNFENPGGMHSEDRTRMRYFAALGRAAKDRTVENIEMVTQFGKPFDPLLTYFLHAEVAELYAKANHPAPRAELRHRLHSIYFTSSHDRSMHNLHAAIALILEFPEACDSPLDRWDQLNGLLQMLQQRWEVRGAGRPGPPKTELRDIDVSLVAIERSFRAMDQLAKDAGLSQEESDLRQVVLDRNLVLPLRSYRTKLRPLVGREEILEEYSKPSSPLNNAIDMTP